MQATQHSADTRRAVTEPQPFPPLELVNRPTVPTEQAAFYLCRRPQTLRGWASAESFPDGLRPVRWLNELEYIDGAIWANVWRRLS